MFLLALLLVNFVYGVRGLRMLLHYLLRVHIRLVVGFRVSSRGRSVRDTDRSLFFWIG